jgi:uncharacterized protein with von Willebrand factor type A (vWA) domain
VRHASFRRLRQTRIGALRGEKVIDLNRAYRACLESAGEQIDPIVADRILRNPVADDEPMERR